MNVTVENRNVGNNEADNGIVRVAYVYAYDYEKIKLGDIMII